MAKRSDEPVYIILFDSTGDFVLAYSKDDIIDRLEAWDIDTLNDVRIFELGNEVSDRVTRSWSVEDL